MEMSENTWENDQNADVSSISNSRYSAVVNAFNMSSDDLIVLPICFTHNWLSITSDVFTFYVAINFSSPTPKLLRWQSRSILELYRLESNPVTNSTLKLNFQFSSAKLLVVIDFTLLLRISSQCKLNITNSNFAHISIGKFIHFCHSLTEDIISAVFKSFQYI